MDDDLELVSLIGLAGSTPLGASSVVLLEGEREDGTAVTVAAEPRLAQAALAALGDGEPVTVEVEPWQIWTVRRG